MAETEVFENIKNTVDKISKGLMYKELFTYSKKEQQEIDYHKTEIAKFIKEYKDLFLTNNSDANSSTNTKVSSDSEDNKKLYSDLNNFLYNVINFCKITEHPGVEKELPRVSVGSKLNQGNLGYYQSNTNYINVSSEYYSDFCNGKLDLADLINTLGHEMEHWSQHYYKKIFDTIPPKYQPAVFNYVQQQVNDINKTYQIMSRNTSTFNTFTDCFKDKVKPEDIPKEFGGNKKQFFMDAFLGSYFSSGSEKDAREAGRNFVSNISYEIPELKDYINEETQNYYYGNEDIKCVQTKIQSHKDMVKVLNKNLSEEDVLKIASSVLNNKDEDKEKSSEKPTISILDFLLAGKTYEQKINLLKGAVKDNNNKFLNRILIDLQRDVNYKQNKEKISNMLTDSLIGEANYEPKLDTVSSVLNMVDLSQKNFDKFMLASILKKSEFLDDMTVNDLFMNSPYSFNVTQYYENFIKKCRILKNRVNKEKLSETEQFDVFFIHNFGDVLREQMISNPTFIDQFKNVSDAVEFINKTIDSKLNGEEEKNNKKRKKSNELTPEQLKIIDDRKLKACKQEGGVSLE